MKDYGKKLCKRTSYCDLNTIFKVTLCFKQKPSSITFNLTFLNVTILVEQDCLYMQFITRGQNSA